MKQFIVVDCESDGPCPGTDMYSLVCFGMVVVNSNLDKTFYGKTRPISEKWQPDALAVSGFSREQHQKFDEPEKVFREAKEWLKINVKGNPVFVSDNVAYDWQWINYYFHKYTGSNPFGFSGRRIGDIYSGLYKDMSAKWKHLKKTRHDHNPVNDAIGNAEALRHIVTSLGQGHLVK